MNLSRARKGQKYVMQDGETAVYIGRDSKLQRPYIFRVSNYIVTRMKDGKHCSCCNGSVYQRIVRKK
jgi:hypothetical protein